MIGYVATFYLVFVNRMAVLVIVSAVVVFALLKIVFQLSLKKVN